MPDTTASQHSVFELHNSNFTTNIRSLINVSHLTEGFETLYGLRISAVMKQIRD
jgi:hypothetical protein